MAEAVSTARRRPKQALTDESVCAKSGDQRRLAFGHVPLAHRGPIFNSIGSFVTRISVRACEIIIVADLVSTSQLVSIFASLGRPSIIHAP